MQHLKKQIMSSFWLSLWAFTLAFGWILPNHYHPWTTFHAEVWVAVVLLLAAAAVIFRTRDLFVWHRLPVLVAFLICVPWVQHVSGLLPLAGNAWIPTAYLLGFLLTLLIGAQWESSSPGQLADGLFLAIGVGAVLSVGLQFYQWLEMEGLGMWAIDGGEIRPYANFAQPNLLATFLLWAVLAAAWGLVRGYIGGWTAGLMAMYLLFGVALTGSRTAWLAVALLVGVSWLWRRWWETPWFHWIGTALGLYFVACVIGLGWVRVDSTGTLAEVTRMGSDLRLPAWALFMDAVWQSPIWGYGWNQVVTAQLAVASAHPALHVVFLSSHNLILDLVLWCGIPLGLGISVYLLMWFWRRLRAVDEAENAILLLLLLVVANHAMLELPLHHAYFLLPAGLVMGSLHTRMGARRVTMVARWVFVCLWLAATSLLVLFIRDYARIEKSYQILRLEWAHIKMAEPREAPNVLLLNQWYDYIRYARWEPKAGLAEDEINLLRNISNLFPDPVTMHKLAISLALNGHQDEAQRWLKKLCKMTTEDQCQLVEKVWAEQSLIHPEIAAIPWPVKTTD